jgi:hypothetical protein
MGDEPFYRSGKKIEPDRAVPRLTVETLWALSKDQHVMTCLIIEAPVGDELRVLVDGEMYLTECRDDRAARNFDRARAGSAMIRPIKVGAAPMPRKDRGSDGGVAEIDQSSERAERGASDGYDTSRFLDHRGHGCRSAGAGTRAGP